MEEMRHGQNFDSDKICNVREGEIGDSKLVYIVCFFSCLLVCRHLKSYA